MRADTFLVQPAAITMTAPEPGASTLWMWVRWMPLFVLAGVLGYSAITGSSAAPNASAASTIDVTGLVDKQVYLDATGCSGASSLDIGDLVPGDPWKRTSADCAVLFGSTNSSLGADLTVLEDPGAPAAPTGAMKCNAATCTGGSWDEQLDDVSGGTPPPPAGTSAFGIQLESATGLATAAWTIGDAQPVAASQTPCSTAAIGDGTCAFRFGASADAANDGPGAYQAQVQFLVLAR